LTKQQGDEIMEKEIERIVRILRLLDERKLRVIYFFVLGMM